MNLRSGLFTGGLCLVGLLGGMGARKLAHDPIVPERKEVGSSEARGDSRTTSANAVELTGSQVVGTAGRVFDDTLDDLLEAPEALSYRRVAHWLLNAEAADIARFWQAVREDANEDLHRLIFVHWMRLAPSEAMAATVGSEWEDVAWWARACLDPEGALRAWKDGGPWERGKDVAFAIGECHPDWLRENLPRIPEWFHDDAVSGFAEWSEGGDPREHLNFVADHNAWGSDQMFRRMIRNDPWAAWEWVQENEYRQVADSFGQVNSPYEGLVKFLKEGDPEVLAELAQREPPGSRRRSVERAIFDNLLASDPMAALQEARSNSSPGIVGERLFKVGAEIAAEDPQKTMELLREGLSYVEDPFGATVRVRTPSDSTEWGHDDLHDSVHTMLGALVHADPESLFTLHPTDRWQEVVVSRWAFEDTDGFIEWLDQTDLTDRDSHASLVTRRLRRDKRHEDAADWLLKMAGGQQRERELQSLIVDWSKADPAQASEWVNSAETSPEERATLRSYLEKQ